MPLWRAEGRSGDPKVPGAEALIPVAGMFTLFRHGKDGGAQAGHIGDRLVARHHPSVAVVTTTVTLSSASASTRTEK